MKSENFTFLTSPFTLQVRPHGLEVFLVFAFAVTVPISMVSMCFEYTVNRAVNLFFRWFPFGFLSIIFVACGNGQPSTTARIRQMAVSNWNDYFILKKRGKRRKRDYGKEAGHNWNGSLRPGLGGCDEKLCYVCKDGIWQKKGALDFLVGGP